MARRIDSLLQGKYKNIPFFVRRESIAEVGDKKVVHDYFNSPSRYAESQGRMPLEFSVDIFFSGENWIDDWRRFRAAIEDPASGTLILPTLGVFTSIVALPSPVEASQKTVGEISMTVTFTESIERPSPTDSTITQEDAAAQTFRSLDELNKIFTDGYEIPEGANNIATATSDFKSLAGDVQKITGKVRQAQNFIRKVDGALRNVTAMSDLLFSPNNPLGFLFQTLSTVTGTDAFRTFSNIATSGTTQSNSMNDINNGIQPSPSRGTQTPQPDPVLPNTNINLWDDDTTARRQRNNNRLVVVNSFRVTGLLGMYNTAAQTEYTTTDQIDAAKSKLYNYYTAIVENDTTGVIIPDVKLSLDRVKGLTEAVLENARQNAYAVVEVNLDQYYPVPLLVYELYGERIQNVAQLNFLSDIIRGLNKQQTPHRLFGTTRVIEIR